MTIAVAVVISLLPLPTMAQEQEPEAGDTAQPGYSTIIKGEGIEPIPLNRAQSDRLAFALANKYLNEGKFAEGIEILVALQKRRPKDRQVADTLGRAEAAWAQKLMSERKFDQSMEVLAAAEQHNPGNRDIQILLAQNEVVLGRPKDAIRRMEVLAPQHPDWPRPRIELALAHAAAGNIRTAKAILIAELGKNPPPHVRRNLEAAIRDLEDKQTFVGRFSVGVAPDSNITGGTYNDTIEYLGLPFTLNDDAKQQSGVRGSVSAGGTVRTDWKGRFRPELSLDIAHSEPLGDKGTASSNARLAAAVRLRWSKGNARIGVAGQPFYWDNDLQRIERSLFLEGGRQVGKTTSMVGNLTLTGGNIYNDALRDYWQWETGIGPSLALSPNTRLQLTGVFGMRNAEIDLYSFIRRGVSANLAMQPAEGWRVTLAGALTRDVYGEENVPFGATQEDLVTAANLGIVKNDWVFFGLSPSLSLGYSEVRSTIDLYDKRSVTFNLGVALPY